MAASVNRSSAENREKVQKIFIQRDYSEGTNVKFQAKFPAELDGLIDRHLFEQTINTLNRIYAEAEKTSTTTFCESCLACLTSYVIYLCIETHYQKCLKRIAAYLEDQNETVWLPRGLLITDPIERGLRVIEISVLVDSSTRVMPRLFEGICPQFTQPVFDLCKSVGIKTVADFMTQDPEILAKKLKTPFKDVLIIHRSLTVQFSGFTQSASSLFNELLETISILDTGSKRLNKFLKGGVYTGEVTEIHGPPGSGKTQFCLSVISNLILESNSTVLYLDTSGNFTGKRLLQMLQKSNEKQDFTKKLQNVKIMQIYNIYDLFDSIGSLDSELNKQESPFSRHMKVLVLDSVTPLLAPCFGSKFLDAVSLMNNLSQQLNGLCSEHKLSVLVCNNTVQAKGSHIKPALGMHWKYVPSVSLSIEKSNDSVHKIKTVKSCRCGLSGNVTFKISEACISD